MNQSPSSNDSMDTANLLRARELMPWYAQGLLTGDDQAFMTHWLETSMAHTAEFTAEQAWLQSTRTQLLLAASTAEQSNAASAEQGLSALMQRIAQSQGSTHASDSSTSTSSIEAINSIANNHLNTRTRGTNDAKNSSAKPQNARSTHANTSQGLLDRIGAWLSDTLGIRQPALAFGMAALVLLQAGVIGALLTSGSSEQVPLSGSQPPTSAAADQVILTVAFNPQATEQAMRELLAASGAQLVAGPSALGLYSVAVPTARAAEAAAQLRAAKDVVESVQP